MLCLSFPRGEVGFPYDGGGGAFPSGGFTMGGANVCDIDGGVAREVGVPWFIIDEIFCSLWSGKVTVFWGREGVELWEGEEFCGAEITSNCGIAVVGSETEGAALWFHEGVNYFLLVFS